MAQTSGRRSSCLIMDFAPKPSRILMIKDPLPTSSSVLLTATAGSDDDVMITSDDVISTGSGSDVEQVENGTYTEVAKTRNDTEEQNPKAEEKENEDDEAASAEHAKQVIFENVVNLLSSSRSRDGSSGAWSTQSTASSGFSDNPGFDLGLFFDSASDAATSSNGSAITPGQQRNGSSQETKSGKNSTKPKDSRSYQVMKREEENQDYEEDEDEEEEYVDAVCAALFDNPGAFVPRVPFLPPHTQVPFAPRPQAVPPPPPVTTTVVQVTLPQAVALTKTAPKPCSKRFLTPEDNEWWDRKISSHAYNNKTGPRLTKPATTFGPRWVNQVPVRRRDLPNINFCGEFVHGNEEEEVVVI